MLFNEKQYGPPEVLKEPNKVQNCWKQHWTWVSSPCGCTSNCEFIHLKVLKGNRVRECNQWMLTYAFLLQAAESESGIWIWSSLSPQTFSVRKTQPTGPLFAPGHFGVYMWTKGHFYPSFVWLQKAVWQGSKWNKRCMLKKVHFKFKKDLSFWTWLSGKFRSGC